MRAPPQRQEGNPRMSERIQPTSQRLEELVMPNGGQRFTGSDFRALRLPGVYLFMKEKAALYVGMASCLLQRAGSKQHAQADQAIAECDEVLFYPCQSIDAAVELERLLIWKLKPDFNHNSKTGRKYHLDRLSERQSTKFYRGFRPGLHRFPQPADSPFYRKKSNK